MNKYVLVGFLICASVGFAEVVTLKGGGRVEAPLLKEVDDAVVLDLGYDVLRIPRDKVLRMDKDKAALTSESDLVDTNRLYTIAVPKRITTSEAVKKYAPAVVLVKTPSGLGSGFIVNKKGYLMTNFHVIAGEKHITVTQFLLDGKVLRRVLHKKVEIVAVAPFHDLCVLRIKDFDGKVDPVVFAPKENLTIGETVFAIGNPLGLERTVTEGVLSQTHRNFGGILYLQVDAPVNPGNSGGPLFNARGQVIGVINMSARRMEGLNFAIPARIAKYILDHIDAFAYDESNPESGLVYPDAPRKPTKFLNELKKEKKQKK